MSAASAALNRAGHAHRIVGHESLFDVVLTTQRVTDYREFIAADNAKGDRFNASLRSSGILKAPGKTYVSTALSEDDLDEIEDAFNSAARAL